MKTSINDFITDYSKIVIPDIVCTEPMYHGPNHKKINVYNTSISSSMQKIWLRMPKMKIFKPTFNMTGDKNVPVTVLFGPNVGNVKRFRLFIKKLEKNIMNMLKNNKKKCKSSIKINNNFNDSINLKMPCHKNNDCYEFLFHIYNENNQRISVKSLDSGTFISSFIELSEIWISDTEYGFNWKVLQMKVYPDFDFSKCLFTDEMKEEDETKNDETKNDECYHCMYCPNKHVRTHYCNNHQQPMMINHQQPMMINHQQPMMINYQQPMVSSGQYLMNDQSQIPINGPPPPPPPIINKNKEQVKTFFRPSITLNDLRSIKLKPLNSEPKSKQNFKSIMKSVINELKNDKTIDTTKKYNEIIADNLFINK
jgi:hypothetical protein